MKSTKFEKSWRVFVILVGLSILPTSSSHATTIFFDDFNDGVIDPALWMDNGKTGGSVTEHDGVLDVNVENSNDIQYMTIPDFLVDADKITLEVRIQARYIKPDKNAGFWYGDEYGNVGFNIVFSQKWQRMNTPLGNRGPQYHRSDSGWGR